MSAAPTNAFTLHINGVLLGQFSSVDILQPASQMGPGSLTLKQTQSKLRGSLKWADIELKSGGTSAEGAAPLVLHGFRSVGNSSALQAAVRIGEIVLWDAVGKPTARWNFTNAWPTKVQYDGAASGDLVLLVEGLRRQP